MTLTTKDTVFLAKLKQLVEDEEIRIELKVDRPSYMSLRGAYGHKIYDTFAMSRQGVRWRFDHIFNRIYVAAFETILAIESDYGTQLRDHAIRISRERYALRQSALKTEFQSADRLVMDRK